jgi:hypothetical protein
MYPHDEAALLAYLAAAAEDRGAQWIDAVLAGQIRLKGAA